jgi:multicomponent Na+:H+ antiporter subunit E
VRFLINLFVAGGLWALMTNGRIDAWIVGGPVVLAATLVASRLGGGCRWSIPGFVRFVPHFARDSFLGAVDVAWRSLHPRLPIDPRQLQYDLRLPAGTARVFFVNVVNLLPGTVGTDLTGDVLHLHVIDGKQPTPQQLAKFEQIVAGLFATRLASIQEIGDGES